MTRIAEVGKYYAPLPGGIENYVRECAHILSREFPLKVFCMRKGAGRATEEVIDGVPVFRAASLGSFWRQEIPLGLNPALERWRPDVIHFHAPNPLVAALLERWCGRARLVVTHHSDLPRPGPVQRVAFHFYRKLLDAASAIIVFTRANAGVSREIVQYGDKVVLVPHGVDAAQFSRRERPLAAIRKLGFLGRLEQWKGLDVLLAAARRRRELEVHIAGSGSYESALQRSVHAQGLAQRVFFHGNVFGARKAAFLDSLDALVLPSLNTGESFGIVLVEAQLSGVPVIASDLPTGVSEIAEDGRYGWTFRTGDPGSLLSVIDRMNAAPARVALIAAHAHRNAMARYTKAAVQAQLLDVFRRVGER